MNISGKCLCGSVKLTVALLNNAVAACHCSMCRNWSGGPLLAVDCGDSLTIEDDTTVTRYQSSDWAERGFCSQCGTHLFYYLKPNNQYHLPAGLLNIEDKYSLTHQIFIDEKPEYYNFSNKTENMTGAELFAYFENDNKSEE